MHLDDPLLWQIRFRGIPHSTRTELQSRIPAREGSPLSEILLQRTIESVKAFNSHLEVFANRVYVPDPNFTPDFENVPLEWRDRAMALEAGRKFEPPPTGNAVTLEIYDPTMVPKRIQLEPAALESIEKVAPVRPAQSSESGSVQLTVVLSKRGTVIDIHPLAGPEPLLPPAIDAVSQWKYRPVLLNGLPVEVQTSVVVDFAPR
jgi:hypothetical protein